MEIQLKYTLETWNFLDASVSAGTLVFEKQRCLEEARQSAQSLLRRAMMTRRLIYGSDLVPGYTARV